MKKLAVIVVILSLMLVVSGCGSSNNGVVESISNSVTQMLKGNVKGDVGKTYSTQWFEFTIASINKVNSYAGYTPASGHSLYDVVIKEKSTFEEDSIMGTFDFYMDADNFEEYIFPLDPLDDTMMPLEFILKQGESTEYHMVYEIPDSPVELKLCYTEIDEEENEGAVFTIAIK